MRCLRPILAVLSCLAAAAAEAGLPVLESNRPVVSIREGETLREDAWRLSPETRPDVYEVGLEEGRPKKVTFVSDVGSISFDVTEGSQHDFITFPGAAPVVRRRHAVPRVLPEKP